MEQVFIYLTGTAGSGKTYMTKAIADWFDLKKLDYLTVNLDPGADFLPYSADIDVREWFTLEDIMGRYNVGPNGAQIIGADLVSTLVDDIKDEIQLSSSEYVLIDTPGQLELFTLRESSRILVNVLNPERSVMVYLFDPVVSKTPSGFLSMLFMASSAVFRLEIPQVLVLSKSDLLTERELEKIVEWSRDPETLYDSLDLERKTLNLELFLLLKDAGLFRPLIPASALTGYGMEDIYDAIQEIFYGGDDLERILF
ncbi:MAG: ATP/GTP-binding protein [Archaeoglobus sp.]|uniref:PRK13768 family protein n=1 Tax=Archaeoglobus sp. TaxID=1872626 RepID=UPI001E186B58|nr:ATP/GTP-binding protein [Archaeoglobus sp.]MBO8180946.1 ATP/GTP-binding protein [Archaeoglobus sp.]